MPRWLDRLAALFLPDPPEIGPDEDPVFVDVRTRPEYEQEHVAGAVLIPHGQMEARWTELRKHKGDRVLVYCRTGSRSRVAVQILRDKGFEQVENAGGLLPLRLAGVETETG